MALTEADKFEQRVALAANLAKDSSQEQRADLNCSRKTVVNKRKALGIPLDAKTLDLIITAAL